MSEALPPIPRAERRRMFRHFAFFLARHPQHIPGALRVIWWTHRMLKKDAARTNALVIEGCLKEGILRRNAETGLLERVS